MKYFWLLVLVSFLTGGCDGRQDEVTLPSGLTSSIDLSNAANGSISIEAMAENAKFYSFYFGETPGETPVISIDGKASHTYATSGTYTVKVQAHATQSSFISQLEVINVNINAQNPYEGLTLVWADEFNGTSVSENDWAFEIGRGGNGWGNNELQYYRKENASIEDGHLVITARRENFEGAAYTSTRMITKGKREFKYGRIDIRARLPKGQGIWPALWMLGSNISTVSWPACGEIDIMEMIGGQGREKTVHGTLHWDNNGTHACTCDKPGYSLSNGTFHDNFHVFSIQWTETAITWYVDDVQFNKIDITPAELSEFQNSFFFIFNVAVGGNWPGSPDSSTIFPQSLVVDYVRVFQSS